MSSVRVFLRQASYDYPSLKPLIFEMADSLCGEAVRNHSRVVIKPNLLAPASPERAMVTHPMVVKAVVDYCLHRGAHVQVSDSQAMGSFDRVLKESGLGKALKGMDVVCKEFKESVKLDVGEPFNKIEIARDALEADVLISLPKLKTHVQMLMTLGVKNLFGCIVGLRKPEWHFRTGVNREAFAQLLVRIHDAVRPSLTIIDGILAMEGEGPGRLPRFRGYRSVRPRAALQVPTAPSGFLHGPEGGRPGAAAPIPPRRPPEGHPDEQA